MDNILRIVNHLGKGFDQEFTMHELAKKLHIPYATFHRTVSKKQDLLIIRKVGKAKTLKLDPDNPVITSYLSIASEEEKKAFIKSRPIIRIISKELRTEDIVLLFGSYAKGEEREQSDIDIMVINKTGKRTINFSKHELLFQKEINAMYFKKSEFKAMLQGQNENVGKQAVRQHIVLRNPTGFWRLVQNALRKRKI